MKVKSESEVAQSCPTLATPWTAAYQAPPWGFLSKSTGVGAIALQPSEGCFLGVGLRQKLWLGEENAAKIRIYNERQEAKSMNTQPLSHQSPIN